MREKRIPKLGDIIIEHTDKEGYACLCNSDAGYIGFVTDIHLDKYGHQKHVMIDWSKESPPEYNEAWGYSGMNIHNQLRRFTLIRGGVEI